MEKVIIRANSSIFDLKLKEIWQYRDLIWIFVKRNYSTRYKQMILGPLWLFINPLCTVIMYTIVFGGIANLSTDGVPKPLFYLAGNIIWSFFAGCITGVSGTFLNNAAVFGKVYFSRMVSPISTAITGLLDFGIQFILLILLSIYYMYSQNIFLVNGAIILVPFVLLQLMLLAIGIGIIISSLTTKYRDLNVLVGFGMQIWMYASPIIYSLSMIPDRWLNLFMLNPVTPGILIYKYAILGVGYIPYKSWAVSWLVTIIVDILGLMLFNKTERTFMDTV